MSPSSNPGEQCLAGVVIAQPLTIYQLRQIHFYFVQTKEARIQSQNIWIRILLPSLDSLATCGNQKRV